MSDAVVDPDQDPSANNLFNLSNTDWAKGVAHMIMYTISGPMVHDNSDGNVTTGRSRVEYIATGNARFRAIGKNRTLMFHYGGFDTNVAVADEEEMDATTHQLELAYRDPTLARVAGDPGTVPGA